MSVKDQRIERSRERILKITWELLSESGLGGVSIDEISRRSGVAKTTIYRHWKTRSDLLIDACSQLEAKQDIPNKGDLKKDLTSLLSDLAQMLNSAKWSSVLPSVIDSAEREPLIAELHGRLQRAHAQPIHEVIRRAIKAGKLIKISNPKTISAQLLGPMFYRRYFSREPLNKKFIESIVASVLLPLKVK